MRILIVSAHYPPNFVSGGTLVPQRLGHALAARGHEVLVYAGYLDESLPAGHTFEETDGPVRIRWIVTTPWTAWTDRHNFDNPQVLADFRPWVEAIRPDVVHLHSLQTLGAGLVPASKVGGAGVVLTMHDFWWFDARQFLVDEQMRPTALVTDCAAERASQTTAGIRDREAWLREQLQAADYVLAPSEPAAEVLVANGVDPARVRVDENGVEPVVVTRERSNSARLMFAGGADPMKGCDVLLKAVRALPDDGRWTLDMYGVSPERISGMPPTVRARPPYSPAELAAVLAAHDVLVLPSIMRESHSILTREALSAGLAVVTSDCLGPEEAVVDGVNGLVVPTADAGALAEALNALVSDPKRRAAMQERAPQVRLRSFTDQVHGLEETYKAARTNPVREEATPWPRRVLFVVGIQGAPLRYRAHLPAEGLQLLGVATDVRHYRDPELPSLVARADAIVFYRVPATRQVLELIAAVRERREPVPVLFDVDDLIFDPELRGTVRGLERLSPEEEDLWWRGVARYRTTMEQADLFIGSTTTLCGEATRISGLPARRFANGVGIELARLSDAQRLRPRRRGPLRLGYFSGTTTHDRDWAAIEPVVIAAMQRHPQIELVLGGHLTPTPALAAVGDRVRRLPMQPWYRLPAVLRDVDIALAPLEPGSIFNEAKSAIKWLEAALVHTPTIATPTEPFAEAIEHNRTGLLASTPEQWDAALEQLITDATGRKLMGARAARSAMLRWSPHSQGRAYLEVLRAAREVRAARPTAHRPTAWASVYDDEPYSGADAVVEPYSPPSRQLAALVSLRQTRLAGLIVAARRTYRSEGLSGVIHRTRTRVARMGLRR